VSPDVTNSSKRRGGERLTRCGMAKGGPGEGATRRTGRRLSVAAVTHGSGSYWGGEVPKSREKLVNAQRKPVQGLPDGS